MQQSREHVLPRVLGRAVAIGADGTETVVIDGGIARVGAVVLDNAIAAAVVDGGTWIVIEGVSGHALHRFDATGAALDVTQLGDLGTDLVLQVGRGDARVALIEGARSLEVRVDDGVRVSELVRHADRRVLLAGRGIVERRGNLLAPLRGGLPSFELPADVAGATVIGGAIVFDGAAAAIELAQRGKRQVLVFDTRRGGLRSRIRLGDASVHAVAERRGLIVIGRGSHLALLDLREGRCVRERIMPAPVAAVACDANGERIVVIDCAGTVHELGAALTDVDGGGEVVTAPEDDNFESEVETTEGEVEPEAPAPAAIAPAIAPAADDRVALDDIALLALRGTDGAPLASAELDAYLADLRAWVAATCRVAISVGADTGRHGADPAAVLEALLAPRGGQASERVAAARTTAHAAAAQLATWGERAPHRELGRELGVADATALLLVLAAAPHLWTDLARVYKMIALEPGRALVDELLLGELLGADAAGRAAIARDLDACSPLVCSGAISFGAGARPDAAITVHPLVVRRLAGERFGDTEGITRAATRTLVQLVAPAAGLAATVRALAAPVTSVRIVLRGRPGAGRRTLAATLAHRAGRTLATIAVARGGTEPVDVQLVRTLREVSLRGWLPCVCVEELSEEPAVRARVRDVLDAHPGPLVIRAALDQVPPVSPGFIGLDLPPLAETARRDVWAEALASRGLPASLSSRLAARFAVGPGIIARACDRAIGAGDIETAIAMAVRQYVGNRISEIAKRVDRLADWSDLILPADMIDSLHEIVSRVEHRRVVLEDWGMQHIAATARGTTALFQGGPGTGKTMAAGVLAKALGFELWRVDLSKVMSRWLGETEKNLARVFDAAEDGEIILLFDEADSLFGKRTEVKSSNDKYANTEVNYLLQRLDEFTGIAVLTTNFGTAIDPAFKRRLSLHLRFPFPDDDERERLWHAHLPASLPRAGALDLTAIAVRFELSGGLIRNAALRAAYLAATAASPVTNDTLLRAVALEYASHGKLGHGRLE